MQDFISRLGVQFSDKEKQECLPVARRMIELASIVKVEGLLSLESETLVDHDFIKTGANLILDGTAPEMLEKILQHHLLSESHTGTALLERLLIAEAFLTIAKVPNSTQIVAAIVGAMIGEKYAAEILLEVTNKKIDINFLIDEYTSELSESANFEKRLLKLTRLELSYVLMTTNIILLGIALKGCSKSFIYHTKNGLREVNFVEICKLFEGLTPQTHKEAILAEQNSILDYLDQLEASGIFTETFE